MHFHSCMVILSFVEHCLSGWMWEVASEFVYTYTIELQVRTHVPSAVHIHMELRG